MASLHALIAAGSLHLQRPWWLIALLAASLPWLLAWRAKRLGRSVSTISLILQTLALAGLAAALAGPSIPAQTGESPVLLLQDSSASVRTQPAFTPPVDLPVRRVRFAKRPATDPAVVPAGDATNLAPALRYAADVSPPPRAVLIRTDGRFHDDWAAAAKTLAARGIPVAILPMPAPPADARVAAFTAARGADGNVALTVTVAANAALKRTLDIRRTSPDEALLTRRPLVLRAGDRATTRLNVPLPPDQGGTFAASLTPADTVPENDSLTAAVLPQEHRTLLIAPPDARPLGEGIENLDVLNPREAVRELSAASRYSAVIAADATGQQLPQPLRETLGRTVRAGGGLVLVGSGPRRSPADANDPLARSLPLAFDPWKRSKLDVRVVLDASGSMGQQTAQAAGRPQRKFARAVEAVLALGRHLTSVDRLSVWTFADQPTERYNSKGRSPDFAALRRALQAVKPAGATDAGKALSAAVEPAIAADANGLVLLLTDLRTKPLDVAELAEAFERKRLRLAIVTAGKAGETHKGAIQLRHLAEKTDASLVQRDTLAGLAKVFASFVKRSRGDALARGRFELRADGPVFGLPADGWPGVAAYLQGRRKDGAQVLLRTWPGGDPIVARWQVGAGRAVSVALRADELASPARWRKLIAAAARWARRPAGDRRFSARIARSPTGLTLDLTAMEPDGMPINGLSLRARLRAMDDTSADACSPLLQVGPGEYRTSLRCVPRAMYLAVRDARGATVYRQAIGGAIPAEFAALGADRSGLQQLAERTGGREIVRESELVDFLQRARSRGWQDITWLVALIATGMMLIDWVLARVTRRGR